MTGAISPPWERDARNAMKVLAAARGAAAVVGARHACFGTVVLSVLCRHLVRMDRVRCRLFTHVFCKPCRQVVQVHASSLAVKAGKERGRGRVWALKPRKISRGDGNGIEILSVLTRNSVVCELHFDVSFIERTYIPAHYKR